MFDAILVVKWLAKMAAVVKVMVIANEKWGS
jgi:hypothetical protein